MQVKEMQKVETKQSWKPRKMHRNLNIVNSFLRTNNKRTQIVASTMFTLNEISVCILGKSNRNIKRFRAIGKEKNEKIINWCLVGCMHHWQMLNQKRLNEDAYFELTPMVKRWKQMAKFSESFTFIDRKAVLTCTKPLAKTKKQQFFGRRPDERHRPFSLNWFFLPWCAKIYKPFAIL